MNTNRSKFPEENHPVDMISWNDARSYIQKLNAIEISDRYRLPTEAEWEYAARAGSASEFFWGNTMKD